MATKKYLPPTTHTCQHCGEEFTISARHGGKGLYCSIACAAAANVVVMNRTRPRPKGRFTPEQVRGRANGRWVEPLRFVCKLCGNGFERKPWQTRGHGVTNEFCSAACRGAWRTVHLTGPNSPHWVGGNTTYRGKGWKRARLLAVMRDKGTCQDCRKVIGRSIPVHHIHPYRDFATEDEANALDNIVCLCQPCHMKREPRSRPE